MAGELVPSDFTHGYYEFKGLVGGESIDDSGKGFNFTVVGATDKTDGKFNNGLEFDGLNDVGSSAQIRYGDFTDQLGICGWLQVLRTATGVDAYLWKGGSGGGGQDITLHGNNSTAVIHVLNNSGASGQSDARGIISPFFFAINYDGANATLFWDDPSINSSSGAKTGNIRNTDDLTIGALPGNILNAKCRWDQLGIRNAPFTTDELAFMYNGGAGRLLTPLAAAGRRRRMLLGRN